MKLQDSGQHPKLVISLQVLKAFPAIADQQSDCFHDRDQDRFQAGRSGQPDQIVAGGVGMSEVISIEIPMSFRKRGGRKVMVHPDGLMVNPSPKATTDRTLTKALGQAFRWKRLLECGQYGCIEDIARAEKISASRISRIYRLTLLAPVSIEAILEGRQPAGLLLKDLLMPFPLVWEEQQRLMGMA